MGIGAADQSELERIGPDLGLEIQSSLQCRTDVRATDPGIGGVVLDAAVSGPGLEIGEWVVGRGQRMGLAVALYLRRLDDGFPFRTQGRVGGGDRRTAEGSVAERPAATQVAVVRNRDDAAARAGLVLGEVSPQVLGVVAVVPGERQRLPGLLGAPGKQHVAMQHRGRVLVPGEGRERSGVVVALGRLGDGVPNLAPDGVVDREVAGPCGFPGHQRLAEVMEGLGVLGIQHVRDRGGFGEEPGPRPTIFRGEHALVPAHEPWKDAEEFGVVGDHQEIQSPAQPDALATRRDDFLALREPVGILGRDSRAHAEGIPGQVGVHVGVAPVHGVGVGVADR